MAFCSEKNELARHQAFLHAESVLSAYLQGSEKLYAVVYAVNELKALFHEGARASVTLIEQACRTDPEDEETRTRLITKALDVIGQQVRADEATMLRPGQDF